VLVFALDAEPILLLPLPAQAHQGEPANWGNGYANVWLGVSVERNDFCWRTDLLRSLPVRTRWTCAEPLLGPLPVLGLNGIH
jgi:protein gp37